MWKSTSITAYLGGATAYLVGGWVVGRVEKRTSTTKVVKAWAGYSLLNQVFF